MKLQTFLLREIEKKEEAVLSADTKEGKQ